ncbi:uncharacterized protein LOC121376889 [Gigantopelta aegis]|uniref:uncharacterized protein LOC121376889 n=1 Tax=Gigantopelta aegis TaxID=1735272 RepID=UPI001B887D39|nr:uncharacterized protein LOC121376889 [Gigantopelta aegis]
MGRATAFIGIGCVALAVLCMVLAFASPYWVESWGKFQGRFVKIGLWEVCFNDYTFYKDYNGKRYKGCWYIFSNAIRPIWEWISPPWFIAVQVMVSISLLFEVIVAICLILYLFKLFPSYLHTVVMQVSAGAMAICLLFIFISVVVFGLMKEDRDWVPRPDMNFLSWSYGLCCMSGIFCIASSYLLFKASKESKDVDTVYRS